jgi:hypothetical protein
VWAMRMQLAVRTSCDVIELEESHEMRRNMKGMCMRKRNTFVRGRHIGEE